MSIFYRLILVLALITLMLIGCQTSATPTAIPATSTSAPATNTPIPVTDVPVSPANTSIPPTIEPEPTVAPTASPANTKITWDKRYSNKNNDLGEDVLVADDGGFYVVGTTNLDFSRAGARSDVYLIRTNADGKVLWQKTFGGDQSDEGLSITRSRDGNLLIAGTTRSFGADAYLIKVDLDGNEIWSKTYGGPLDESASVRELADGSFMLWGNSVDPSDIIADPGAAGYGGYEGRSNIYLAKVDAAGNQLWSHTFGGKNNLLASAGVQTPDSGFMILASLLRFPEPGDDLYLIKLDKGGNKVWERTWEDGTMAGYDLIRTSDDNYLIAGSYTPLDDTTQAKADYLFIKVNQQGEEVWTSNFGDPDMIDYPMVVAQTVDGGYVAAGELVKDWSGIYPGAISVVKLNQDGMPIWQEVIKSESGHNILRAMVPLPDGSCLIAGSKLMGQQFDAFLTKMEVGAGSSAYLGQTPPGLTPQVFAPGIVSVEGAIDFAATFSSDGTELYFTRRLAGAQNVIYETRLINGVWSEPAPAAFAAGYPAFEPHVTADSNTLYFGWAHSPLSEEKSTLEDGGIWATDRTADGWSAPSYVGQGMFVSSDQSGQIYVTDMNSRSLSKATLIDGRFSKLEYVSAGIHPAIAPDGSYLVYDDGDGNLRVRFRLADGKWGVAKDLTRQGIPASAAIASISPDGKYLFYTDKQDFYWVSTELIKNLKED